jgi:SsrA-binding protein
MLLVKNRRATYDYEIIEKFTAGIVLKGYEVKALREKKANMEGSYIKFIDDDVYVVGLHIGRYSNQSQDISEDEATSPRKLLLTKRELERLKKDLAQKGKTAIPTAIILRNNMIKLEFAVAKGRKQVGKKHLAKERQIRKEMQQEAKRIMSK